MADGWIELFDVETDEVELLLVFDRFEPVDYGCGVFPLVEVVFFRDCAVDAVEDVFADFAYLGLRGVDESAGRFVCEVRLVILKCYECVFVGCSVHSVIIHAKNSILIHKHIPWQKKGNTTFDVTMGSYDGAETCELVGSFLLSQLQDLNINVGLYRDDGLAITNATPRDTENIKKEICRIFNNNGLRITIDANKQIINFLDVTFNLN